MSGAHAERQNMQFTVPLRSLITPLAAVVPVREAQGQYSLSLPTAAGDFYVGIPISSVIPSVLTNDQRVDRMGFKLEQIWLSYAIGAVDLQQHSVTINQETITGNAARVAATAFGGTLTYDTDDGTSTVLPTTQRAALYKTRVILGTPVYLGGLGQVVTAEWRLQTGAASGTAKIHNVQLVGRQAIAY